MNSKDIKNNVYYKEINQISKYVKIETDYASVFNEEEKKKLIEIYLRDTTNIYNGIVTRLDKIEFQGEKSIFYISKINYFDLITTNILNYTPEKWFNKTLNDEEKHFCERMLSKIQVVAKKHCSIEDIIFNKNLSNVIAISVLIKDKNGKIGLTKRSSNLSISTSFFSTSVTGDVDGDDFENDNPLLSCARREVLEELGINIDKINMRGIAISKNKLQPVILFDALIDKEWEELIDEMKYAKDYNLEVERFLVIPKDNISEVLKMGKFTDATKFHIYLNIV